MDDLELCSICQARPISWPTYDACGDCVMAALEGLEYPEPERPALRDDVSDVLDHMAWASGIARDRLRGEK